MSACLDAWITLLTYVMSDKRSVTVGAPNPTTSSLGTFSLYTVHSIYIIYILVLGNYRLTIIPILSLQNYFRFRAGILIRFTRTRENPAAEGRRTPICAV